MKKLFSLVACCALLGFFAGCGCCKKSSSKPHKKEMKHKDTKHKDTKHKEMKKAQDKKGFVVRAESEADKIWCDICNMWTGKKHKH